MKMKYHVSLSYTNEKFKQKCSIIKLIVWEYVLSLHIISRDLKKKYLNKDRMEEQ